MAASVSTIAAKVTADTAELEAKMRSGADSINQLTLAATKSSNAMQEQKRAFQASLAPATEADALFENHIASTVMLSQDSKRLTKILDDEAEQIAAVGTAADAASEKIGKVGGAAQQGVFAVDDFIAGWDTGGVSGGIRGASNNLSAIAMQLGGVKGALIGIGAVSAVQIGLKLWDRHQQQLIDEAKKAIDELHARLKAIAQTKFSGIAGNSAIRDISQISDLTAANQRRDDAEFAVEQANARAGAQRDVVEGLREELRIINERAPFVGQADAATEARRQALIDIIAQEDIELTTLKSEAGAANQILQATIQRQRVMEAVVAAQERALQQAQHEQQIANHLAIEQEIDRNAAKGLDELDKRLEEILNPKDAQITSILEDVEKQIVAITDAVGAGILSQDEADDLLQQVQDAADKQSRALIQPDAGLFGRLPGLAAQGSSAAVSTINQASAGSRNMQDQQRLLNASERTAKASERTRELIEQARDDVSQVVGV